MDDLPNHLFTCLHDTEERRIMERISNGIRFMVFLFNETNLNFIKFINSIGKISYYSKMF